MGSYKRGKIVRFLPCVWPCVAGDIETFYKNPLQLKGSQKATKSHPLQTPIHSDKFQTSAARDLDLQGSSDDGNYIAAATSQQLIAVHTRESSSTFEQPRLITASSLQPIYRSPSPALESAEQPRRTPPSTAPAAPQGTETTRPPLPRLQTSWDAVVSIHSPPLDVQTEAIDVQAHQHPPRSSHSLPEPTNQQPATFFRTSTLSSSFSLELDQQFDPESVNDNGPSSSADAQLDPLSSPQTILQDIGLLISINDQSNVLAALILIRRGIRHHRHQLAECLAELLAVVTACVASPDHKVLAASLTATADLIMIYGDLVLQHIYAQSGEFRLVLLLLNYASSTKLPKSIRNAADRVLRRMAKTLHQPSIVRLLEDVAEDLEVAKEVRAKATSTLILATYRLS